MNELKSCPFCNGNNAMLFVDETRGVCVLCPDCGCRTKSSDCRILPGSLFAVTCKCQYQAHYLMPCLFKEKKGL